LEVVLECPYTVCPQYHRNMSLHSYPQLEDIVINSI